MDLNSWQREVQTARREQLEKLAARMRKHGIDVDVAADWDFPPYEAIIRKAQRISADLLVVENHHGSGRHPARWLLAYTDWELLRLCPMPVLLVKNRRLYHRPRVLAAIDPSHAPPSLPISTGRSCAPGRSWCTRCTANCMRCTRCFLALPVMPGHAGWSAGRLRGRTRPDERTRARRDISRAPWTASTSSPVTATWSRAGPTTRSRAPRNASAAAIVAMGVVSRSGLKRFFIGNTAEFVMDAVTADILVVKPRGLRFARPAHGARRADPFAAAPGRLKR